MYKEKSLSHGNMQPRLRRAYTFAHSSQSVSCLHRKRTQFFLNPIIQFNSLNKLYLLMENIYVIYDYFFKSAKGYSRKKYLEGEEGTYFLTQPPMELNFHRH